jgi:hypothetical protein
LGLTSYSHLPPPRSAVTRPHVRHFSWSWPPQSPSEQPDNKGSKPRAEPASDGHPSTSGALRDGHSGEPVPDKPTRDEKGHTTPAQQTNNEKDNDNDKEGIEDHGDKKKQPWNEEDEQAGWQAVEEGRENQARLEAMLRLRESFQSWRTEMLEEPTTFFKRWIHGRQTWFMARVEKVIAEMKTKRDEECRDALLDVMEDAERRVKKGWPRQLTHWELERAEDATKWLLVRKAESDKQNNE